MREARVAWLYSLLFTSRPVPEPHATSFVTGLRVQMVVWPCLHWHMLAGCRHLGTKGKMGFCAAGKGWGERFLLMAGSPHWHEVAKVIRSCAPTDIAAKVRASMRAFEVWWLGTAWHVIDACAHVVQTQLFFAIAMGQVPTSIEPAIGAHWMGGMRPCAHACTHAPARIHVHGRRCAARVDSL